MKREYGSTSVDNYVVSDRSTGPPHSEIRQLDNIIGATTQDPMSGSATTARVALMEGRRFIAIEQEARFIEIIEARLSRDFQQRLFT